jgi:thiosulfate dehydrogenase (quinone) large subunit
MGIPQIREDAMASEIQLGPTTLTDPPLLQTVFNDLRFAWLWLLVRLYVGYEWLHAGWEKTREAAWTQTGLAVKGFWTHAIAVPPPPGRPAIAYDWYRSLIEWLLQNNAHVWFAKFIIFGELAVGIALILGVIVGISAFFGAFMNWNYIMSGTASVNGVMIVLSILLILSWKTAGYWGADRWILRWIGTPWNRSGLFAAGGGSRP